MKDNLGKCKQGTSSLVRPVFREGLLLQDDDLTEGVNYTRALSRMMFSTLFGCGVMCGLKVSTPKLECGKLKIAVAKGIALSCLGDPVELPAPQTIELDELCNGKLGNEIWIGLKSSTKFDGPRTTVCASDDDAPTVCTRERDGFELCAFPVRPACACGCEATAGEEKKNNEMSALVLAEKKAAALLALRQTAEQQAVMSASALVVAEKVEEHAIESLRAAEGALREIEAAIEAGADADAAAANLETGRAKRDEAGQLLEVARSALASAKETQAEKATSAREWLEEYKKAREEVWVAEEKANAAGKVPPAAQPPDAPPGLADASSPCLCNPRSGEKCYADHYSGECPCACCDCEWILLARITRTKDGQPWSVDHSVRRFVRPVLMRDPLLQLPNTPK